MDKKVVVFNSKQANICVVITYYRGIQKYAETALANSWEELDWIAESTLDGIEYAIVWDYTK